MPSAQQTGLFYLGAAPQAVLTGFPVEYKRGLFKQFDVSFLIILTACAIVFGASFLILSLRPLKEETSEKEMIKIQERYAQLVLNQPKPKIKEETEEVKAPEKKTGQKEEAGDAKKEEVKIDRKKESVVEREQRRVATKTDRVKRRAAISQQLQSSGIFAAITATGGGASSGSSSSATDLLGSAEGIGDLGDIKISKGTFATRDVDPQAIKERRRGEKTTGVSIERQGVGTVTGTQIASAGDVNITSEPAQLTGESAGKGSRSQAAINRVVSSEQSRLKKVYESMLKRDPTLSGKLVVKFTIMPDGSVTDVTIVKSTTNNSSFDMRIMSYIKRWKFPEISEGGPVEVIFPFVFTGST